MTTHLLPSVRRLFAHPYHEQRSPEWLKQREGKLTASDVAAAVHKNPYMTQRALLRKKVGEAPKFTGNAATEWGNKYESVAIERYVEETGRVVFEFGLIPHTDPQYSFLAGSPDGVTACGRLIEVKCPLTREITHAIPEYYMPQVQILMEILDLEVCDFIQYRPPNAFMDAEYDVLEIPRDRQWFASNAPILTDFWSMVTNHLKAHTAPSPPPQKKQRTAKPESKKCLFNEDDFPPTPRPSLDGAVAEGLQMFH